MPREREQFLRFRRFHGIDLSSHARVENPAAWQRLENWYQDQPGRLAVRPGMASRLVTPPGSAFIWDDVSLPGGGTIYSNTANTAPIASPGAGIELSLTPVQILALHVLPMPGITQDYIVGALSYRRQRIVFGVPQPVTFHDGLFYIKPSENRGRVMAELVLGPSVSDVQSMFEEFKFTNEEFPDYEINDIQLNPEQTSSLILGAGNEWQFLRIPEFLADSEETVLENDAVRTVMLATNKEDKLVRFRRTVNDDGLVAQDCLFLEFAPDATPRTRASLSAVQALGYYNRSVVYGGYTSTFIDQEDPDPQVEERPHFIRFSDIDNPFALGYGVEIRVGRNKEEPVTALGNISVETDVQGRRGQLAVFTTRQMRVYDGVQPMSGTPEGVSFVNGLNMPFGCTAPGTVVNTPHGLAFLATDKMFYIIRGLEGPQPFGEAIRPAIKDLSTAQLRAATAVWDPNDQHYKVSLPDRADTGVTADAATIQYWADFKEFRLGAKNQGIEWSGPHTGQELRGFAVASGSQDKNNVFAGGSTTPMVYEVTREDRKADAGNAINALAVSPQLDGGDAHADKLATAWEIGIATDVPTTLHTKMISSTAQNTASSSANESRTVTNPGAIWGGFTWGDGQTLYNSKDGFSPEVFRPEKRLRGKSFRLEVRNDQFRQAKIKLSDITVVLQPIPRRRR